MYRPIKKKIQRRVVAGGVVSLALVVTLALTSSLVPEVRAQLHSALSTTPSSATTKSSSTTKPVATSHSVSRDEAAGDD